MVINHDGIAIRSSIDSTVTAQVINSINLGVDSSVYKFQMWGNTVLILVTQITMLILFRFLVLWIIIPFYTQSNANS